MVNDTFNQVIKPNITCPVVGLRGQYQHPLCGILGKKVESESDHEESLQLGGHATRQLAWILFKRSVL